MFLRSWVIKVENCKADKHFRHQGLKKPRWLKIKVSKEKVENFFIVKCNFVINFSF